MMRRLPVLAALLAVIIGAVYYFLLHQPRVAEQAALEAETLALEGQQASLRAEIAQLEQVRADVDRYQADLARLEELIPADVGQPATIDRLQQLADAAQVSIAAFAFADPQPVDPVVPFATDQQLGTIETTITVEGTYFQAVDFVRRLEQEGNRALLVSGVGIAEEPEAGFPALSTTLTGRFFTLMPLVQPPAGAAPVVPPAPGGGSGDAVVSPSDS
jgi:Tfp pilus assembly protein PilO